MEVQVGVETRPKLGEQVCGDAYLVVPVGANQLVGIVDGVGHGPEAAVVADRFISHVLGDPAAALDAIFDGARTVLAGSRGVAATLLRIDTNAGCLEFAGIGNVNLVAHAANPSRPAPQAGIIGRSQPKARVRVLSVTRGDVVALFSDGISSRVQITPFLHLGAEAMARAIVDAHGAHHDDATCMVLQFS